MKENQDLLDLCRLNIMEESVSQSLEADRDTTMMAINRKRNTLAQNLINNRPEIKQELIDERAAFNKENERLMLDDSPSLPTEQSQGPQAGRSPTMKIDQDKFRLALELVDSAKTLVELDKPVSHAQVTWRSWWLKGCKELMAYHMETLNTHLVNRESKTDMSYIEISKDCTGCMNTPKSGRAEKEAWDACYCSDCIYNPILKNKKLVMEIVSTDCSVEETPRLSTEQD